MRSLLIDISPLREAPAFRRLWIGSSVASLGSQVGLFAVTYQTYEITGSSLAVGGLGAFVAVPTLLFSFFGGDLADRWDRRRLAIISASLQSLVAAIFLLQSLARLESLPVLYGLVFAQSTIGAFAVPVRKTFIRTLLSTSSLPSGLALYLFSMHLGQIVGPAAGGLLAVFSVTACYAVQAVLMLASVYSTTRLPRVKVPTRAANQEVTGVFAAIRFARCNPELRDTLLLDLCLTLFGIPVALLPALNDAHFGGSPETLGALMSAISFGGALGAIFSGFTRGVVRDGLGMLCASTVWAAAILVLGIGGSEFWLAVGALAISGLADLFVVTFAQSIVQNVTPDELRGRVSSLEHIVQMGGPQLGNLRAGAMGGILGPTVAIEIGAVAVLVGIAMMVNSGKPLRSYRRPQDADAGVKLA